MPWHRPYPNCHAMVHYDQEEYEQSVELFQDIVAFLLMILLEYLRIFAPQSIVDDEIIDEEVVEAVNMIYDLEEIEQDIGRTIIYSKKLRTFIHKLHPK